MGNEQSYPEEVVAPEPDNNEEETAELYKCKCGYETIKPDNLSHHIESMSPYASCPMKEPLDVSGWSAAMFETVPYVKNSQRGVIARGKPNGLFCVITLINDWDHEQVKKSISQVPLEVKNINIDHHSDLVSTIGVQNDIWRRFDSFPPSGLQAFKEKRAKDTGEVLLPAKGGGHLILFVKGTRVDLCYELSKRLVTNLGPSVYEVDRTITFSYLVTTDYAPNMGRDLSGFIDGTRNPDHLLRALVDQVLIFPRDEERRHVGGCYMYAGKFIHNLSKFQDMSPEEKNQIIGRDYGKDQKHQGYDHRPENPRLDQEEYRSKHVRDAKPSPNRFHTNRAHGAIYRQSMPFAQGNAEGLFFCCLYPIYR